MSEEEFDRIIEWYNQRMAKKCSECRQLFKIIKHKNEGICICSHESYCKYAYLNWKPE